MNVRSNPKRAVMFLRARWLGEAGRDRAMEEHQIALQRQECEAASEQLDVQLVREYVEYGGTGAIERRPVLRQMLDELLALHDVTYVITTRVDRLARTTADIAAIQLELEAAGAELIVTDNSPLPQTYPQQELAAAVASTLA